MANHMIYVNIRVPALLFLFGSPIWECVWQIESFRGSFGWENCRRESMKKKETSFCFGTSMNFTVKPMRIPFSLDFFLTYLSKLLATVEVSSNVDSLPIVFNCTVHPTK